ncbi:hypothetical protein OAQ08_03740 [Alphaproteobacteria bacterium]|nr:hypothetical protein [Alphaproteobacteria bacterium]
MNYWSSGIRYLENNDQIFKSYRQEKNLLNTNKSAFHVLFDSICSQQISTSAASSIQLKSKILFNKITLSNFASDINKINELPITKNKKKSVLSLVKFLTLNKNIKWKLLSELDVYNHLINIFGIGPWTIHMFNIFYRGSSDIVPLNDLGFINSYKKFYKDPLLKKLESNILLWEPYGTIVTINLWSAYDSKQ